MPAQLPTAACCSGRHFCRCLPHAMAGCHHTGHAHQHHQPPCGTHHTKLIPTCTVVLCSSSLFPASFLTAPSCLLGVCVASSVAVKQTVNPNKQRRPTYDFEHTDTCTFPHLLLAKTALELQSPQDPNFPLLTPPPLAHLPQILSRPGIRTVQLDTVPAVSVGTIRSLVRHT